MPGFGVGHKRDAMTKGVWIWSKPIIKDSDTGEPAAMLFIDTEGFEGTGKTDVIHSFQCCFAIRQ